MMHVTTYDPKAGIHVFHYALSRDEMQSIKKTVPQGAFPHEQAGKVIAMV